MSARERFYAFFGCSQTDENVRVEAHPFVTTLNVPSRWYVHRDNGELGFCKEWESGVKRKTDGALEGKAKNSIEDNIRGAKSSLEHIDIA